MICGSVKYLLLYTHAIAISNFSNFHPSFEKPNSGRVEVTLEIDDGSSDSQDNNEEVVAPDNNSPTK